MSICLCFAGLVGCCLLICALCLLFCLVLLFAACLLRLLFVAWFCYCLFCYCLDNSVVWVNDFLICVVVWCFSVL